MNRPRVEILYFEGCPNHERALDVVERVAGELGLQPAIELVAVPDAEAAGRLRFLGSPTVRVDGRDVEPGAEAGQPDERWVRAALVEAAG